MGFSLLISLSTVLFLQGHTPEWHLAAQPSLVVGAEEAPDRVFGRIAGVVRLESGTLVVADGMNLSVTAFDPSGEVVGTAGRRGEGPGEFRTIMSIRRCAGDTLVVYDPAFHRLTVYNHDLEFVDTWPVGRRSGSDGPPPYDFYCGRDGTMVFVHRSPAPPAGIGPRRPEVSLTLTQPDGEPVVLARSRASERYFNGSNDFPRPMGERTSLAVAGGTVFVATGAPLDREDGGFEIQRFALEGTRLSPIRDTMAVHPVSRQDIRRYIEQRVHEQPASRRPGMRDLFESLEYPEAYPSHLSVLVGEDGLVWVEEYPRPGLDQRTWRIYSADGSRLARLRVPVAFRIEQAGADWVAGVAEGPQGEPLAVVYPLIRR